MKNIECKQLLQSCAEKSNNAMLKSDINTIGIKHSITYDSNKLPIKIEYNTFLGSWDESLAGSDSAIRIDIDSIIYDYENKTISLIRIHDFKDEVKKKYRTYYFNKQNLLYKSIYHFSGEDFITDSVVYNYSEQIAIYYDFVNNKRTELQYDDKNNIIEEHERCLEQNTDSYRFFSYDNKNNPFLINFSDDEKLFACFNMKCVGVFWNSFSNPIFCSNSNVLEILHGGEVIKYTYLYRNNLPVKCWGGFGFEYLNYE